MHSAKGMMETGVLGSGIDQVREAGLLDPAEPLKQRMLNNVKNERCPDMNQPVNRIIYELHFVHIAKIGKISPVRASLDNLQVTGPIQQRIVILAYGQD